MNRYAARLLWSVAVVVSIAASALWLYGCTPAPKAQNAAVDLAAASMCREKAIAIILASSDCEAGEAQANAEPSCRAAFPGGVDFHCPVPR
jgi:hypothetical protein